MIALTGITPRQLQWWDERGVVKPEREGHRRLYSMNHLTEVAVICELRRKGSRCRACARSCAFSIARFGKGLAEIVSRSSDYHLLTDGTHLYLETSAQQIVDILKNSDQPILARLPERRGAAGAGWGHLREGEYFSNFAGLPQAC